MRTPSSSGLVLTTIHAVTASDHSYLPPGRLPLNLELQEQSYHWR